MAPLIASLATSAVAGATGSAVAGAAAKGVAAKGLVSKIGGALAKGSGSPLGALTQGPAAQTGLQKFGSTLEKVGGVIDKLPKRPQTVDNTLPGVGPIGGRGGGGSLPDLSVISKLFGAETSEQEEQPAVVGQLAPGFSKLDRGGF